jgi:hypothetical protein
MSRNFSSQTAIDPRTQLPLVGIPHVLAAFRELNDCVIHWISPVKSIDSSNKETDLIAILGDSALYACELSGNILRCLMIKEIAEILVRVGAPDKDLFVGLKVVAGAQEFDLLLKVAAVEDVQILVGFVRRIFWVHMGLELPVYRVGPLEQIATMLSLTRPHRWTLRMEPIRKRKYLDKLLYDFQQSEAKDFQAIEEEFVRVKRELQAAVMSIRDKEYNSIVQQNVRLLAEVGTERLRVEEMKRLLRRFVPDVDEALEQAVIAAREQEVRAAETNSASSSPQRVAESFASNGIAQIFRQQSRLQAQRPCERCKKLKQLLDEHPNVDKVRCAQAEDALAEVRLAETHLRQQVEPLRKEILMLRALLSHTFTALVDESCASSDRIRTAVGLIGPLAHLQQPVKPAIDDGPNASPLPRRSSAKKQVDTAAVPGDLPAASAGSPTVTLQSTEYLTVREEIAALRTLLREVSNMHTAEIMEIRREIQEYDAHMLDVLRDAIDHHQPLPGLSAVRAASAIFDSAKQGFGKSLISGSPLEFLLGSDAHDGGDRKHSADQAAQSFSPLRSVRWARQS